MCVLWSDQDNNECLVTHECLKKKAKEVLFSESRRCFFCSIVVVESWLLHLLHNVNTVWLLHLAFLKHGSRKPEDDDKHIQECNLKLLFIILTLLVILILQKSWETLHFLFYTSLQRSISFAQNTNSLVDNSNTLFGRWDMKAKALPKAFKEGIDLSLQPKMENWEEEENINISDCVATLK